MIGDEAAKLPPMQNQVKPAQSLREGPPGAFYRSLLFYFLFTIALVGGLFCYLLAMPLWLVGVAWIPARDLGGRVMSTGVSALLKLQPWLCVEDEFRLPPRTTRNFMTVSNHRSHLDMFLLLARVPNIRVIAKAALFRVPFLGLAMRAMRMIPVKQGDMDSYWAAMETALAAARAGEAVHIFPEMTRCRAFAPGTENFHLAPFRIAIQGNLPLVPVVFIDTDRTWPKGVFGLGYRRKMKMRSLEAVEPSSFPSAEAMRAEVQRRILQQLGHA